MMKDAACDKAFISRTAKCEKEFTFVDSEFHFENREGANYAQ